jgi:hypothetical protein
MSDKIGQNLKHWVEVDVVFCRTHTLVLVCELIATMASSHSLFERVRACKVGYDWIHFGSMAPATSTTM